MYYILVTAVSGKCNCEQNTNWQEWLEVTAKVPN